MINEALIKHKHSTMSNDNTSYLRYVIEMFWREDGAKTVRVGLELRLEETNLAKNCDYKGFLARG